MNTIQVRLPNWLGDVVMALPVIRAIHANNPSLKILGLAQFESLFHYFNFNLEYRGLPDKNWHYYFHFLKNNDLITHTILLANSQRSDLEAWLSRIPQRYGISWEDRPRKLLNHRFNIKHPESDGGRHQTCLWSDFTKYHGFHNGIDLSPLMINQAPKNQIVLICGSENNAEKRWPVDAWIQLIKQLLSKMNVDIVLTGTRKDYELTHKIAEAINHPHVYNQAGKMQLSEFTDCLYQSRLVIGNDTGGLHLANAVGTAVIGLYGPTNPQRTGPIFQAPLSIVYPRIGNKMKDIAVEDVLQSVSEIYN